MADNEKGNKVRSQDIGTSSSRVNEAPDTSCVAVVQHLINQNQLLIEILQQHRMPILNPSQMQPQVQLEAVQALTPQVSAPPTPQKAPHAMPHVDPKEASIICFMCDEQGHYARNCPQQKRKAPMRTEDEVRKMIITSTEWPPPGMTKHQRRNSFRGAQQLTEHLLANGGRVSDSEDSDQVSSDDEDEMERKACSRCGEVGHVASSCATTCFHCEEDHPPGECPMSRITCFFCEGTDHVPKDCQFSFLLTKKMANQPASSNGEKHQGNTNPRQDYSFSLTPVPGQRNQNEKRKCRVREDICCFNCQGMGHFADKCPKPRNIAASTSVHAAPCNQKLAPQRIVIHASQSSPMARVATAPTPASALPQGVNAHFQPQQRIVVDGRSCVSPRPTPGQAKGNRPPEGDTKQKTHLLSAVAAVLRLAAAAAPLLLPTRRHLPRHRRIAVDLVRASVSLADRRSTVVIVIPSRAAVSLRSGRRSRRRRCPGTPQLRKIRSSWKLKPSFGKASKSKRSFGGEVLGGVLAYTPVERL
uniref:Zinc knuckle containing protein-like n=1 Tax=Oryza sativa subsp. japonica TaxID=39947 RepID=Q5VMS4_ORYSJ|nr:Zinc knuckle containing protein-like [Oryza sativa Japonica Group]